MNGFLKRLALAVSVVFILSPMAAHADVVAYSSGAKQLFIESAPQLGKKTYLIEFTGVDSHWSGKVIKVEKNITPSGDRYSFEHDVNLSSGTIKRNYQILVDGDPTLVQGTIVPVIELYYVGGSNDGLLFAQDGGLTKSSQNINLAQQYQSAPYQPEME